ncbi:MAG: RIP metalloprotease RseP, partial [Planctomycetota bacterium]
MLSWLCGWAGLILGFSGLIFVHELGHFILAKWHGVRVYVFSLGMGPYLVSCTWRGTVYVLSLVPIGGYVKMMGQDDLNPNAPPSRNKRDYRNKRAGQKAAILAAGALFNLLFAFLIFALCYGIGLHVEPPRLGNIAPDQPLAQAMLYPRSAGQPAGLQKGDRILEVNGVPVKTFIEAVLQISSSRRDQDIYLKIERYPELVVVKARHDKAFGASSIGLSRYEERVRLPLGFRTEDHVVIMEDPKENKKTRTMPAAEAGLRKGDVVLKITDAGGPGGPVAKELKDSDDFVNAVRGSEGRPLTLVIRRGEELAAVELQPRKPEDSDAFQIGVHHGLQLRVVQIDTAAQAYAAGMRVGDFWVGLEPEKPNAEEWKTGHSFAGDKVQLAWKKDWDSTAAEKATVTVPADSLLAATFGRSAWEELKAENLSSALGMAWDDTVRFSGVVFTIMRRMA